MTQQLSKARVLAALAKATAKLLSEMNPEGHWRGQLSSSALSTATAIIALTQISQPHNRPLDTALIESGLQWLINHQNADGGWGDTDRSKSNVSTTALVWAAFGAVGADEIYPGAMLRCRQWLQTASNSHTEAWTPQLAETIRERYGKDRTFSVPILMACALSGRLGADGWQEVPALPFELAAVPHQFYGAIQLPVVSYALPALIAIGHVVHKHAPTQNYVLRLIRDALISKTSRILEGLQPSNGGFLEATPLTSFVLMSLAACGRSGDLTARRAADFLRGSARADGSWPIDTDLATWASTLSINALVRQPKILGYEQRSALREWILRQQYQTEHPYTHAAPGGWAWTDLPGAVPDADDTPGALLALLQLGPLDDRALAAGQSGVNWLLGLQNKDGGIPTFCRGWGTLPFDRSGEDLTAHTLRAWSAWLPHLNKDAKPRIYNAIAKGITFLERRQRADGTWVPLWFGNEHAAEDENPVWGTSRVIVALRDLRIRGFEVPPNMITRGERALASMQQESGGWSGSAGNSMPCSIEETGMALEALAGTASVTCVDRAALWLVEQIEADKWCQPSPVGFYFARLWYYEKLYPQIAAVAGLGAAAAVLTDDQ